MDWTEVWLVDVMPIYVIDRKFTDTSGKSITYPSASFNMVPSVCVSVCARARAHVARWQGAACTSWSCQPPWNSWRATGDGELTRLAQLRITMYTVADFFDFFFYHWSFNTLLFLVMSENTLICCHIFPAKYPKLWFWFPVLQLCGNWWYLKLCPFKSYFNYSSHKS